MNILCTFHIFMYGYVTNTSLPEPHYIQIKLKKTIKNFLNFSFIKMTFSVAININHSELVFLSSLVVHRICFLVLTHIHL